ncbi:MAG: alpha-L-rhamnosidase [Mucilaginibacter sp.]|nr:alpha-L-rhamnosidase [Mucilaginibacter sp.]
MIKSLILFSLLLISTAFAADLKPVLLTCEYKENPLGIDIKKPGLTWTLSSKKRNQIQSAYEIIVSDNETAINQLKGNMWNSGKVISSETVQIEYNGLPLSSYTKYYWRVRVYDGDGNPSGWSKNAWFETAALETTDWKAKWIGDGRTQFKNDSDFYKDDSMPLFKKVIKVTKRIVAARLYISGLGYYEAYLNGTKIGNNVLDPGFTSYRKQVLYTTYDITDQVKKGNNILSIMLGNGWYNPLPIRLFGEFNLRNVQQTGRPCLSAQLYIKYNNGSTQWVLTDPSWYTATGQIVFNNVYLGEHDDGRLARNDFFKDDFSGWKNAVVTDGPDGHLSAQMQPPIKITRTIRPIGITEAGKDTFIVDMGQNFAGVARIKVTGPLGTNIKLRYGEELFSDGRLNYFTSVTGQIKEKWHLNGGPGAPKTAWQEDSYILKGKGVEEWYPRFTFHGFRYVQVTGWPGKPTLNDIEGLRMNSDLVQDGSFSCSNEMLNRLHEVVQWTFLSNVFSVQSDCPAREKMGYGADMIVTSQAYCYNYNMANFYRKSVTDFANDQLPDGGITELSPYTGIHSESVSGESGPPGWQLAFPYLQKQLYDYYGDKRIIANNYSAFTRQIDFLQSKAYENLFDHEIGDHEALDPKPIAFDASLFYYHHVLLAADFAGILGKTQDSIKYTSLANKIKNAIITKFYIPGTGRYDNATEGAEIFALWYNLSADKSLAYRALMKEFERHNFHVSTGIFSTKMLFDVLRESDQNEIAYKMANQRDFPGWGYMLSKNATTLWESWAFSDNVYSQNHPMFGSIDEWFYKSLLGINEAAPGFKKIIIKPQPAGDLTWAKGNYNSVSGNIISDWKIENGFFNLHILIPANTTAEVWIPAKEKSAITEQRQPIEKIAGFKSLKYQDGYEVISIGSGEYDFKALVK